MGRAQLTLAGAVDCDCGQCWWIGLSLSQVHGLRPHESSKSDLASHSDFVNLAFLVLCVTLLDSWSLFYHHTDTVSVKKAAMHSNAKN